MTKISFFLLGAGNKARLAVFVGLHRVVSHQPSDDGGQQGMNQVLKPRDLHASQFIDHLFLDARSQNVLCSSFQVVCDAIDILEFRTSACNIFPSKQAAQSPVQMGAS